MVLRVLGIAYRPLENVPQEITPDIERGLYLLALVGIVDPARPEAKGRCSESARGWHPQYHDYR